MRADTGRGRDFPRFPSLSQRRLGAGGRSDEEMLCMALLMVKRYRISEI